MMMMMGTEATKAEATKPAPKGVAPLRRATYVNVLKLVQNNYDINLERLADELARLKVKQGQGLKGEGDAKTGTGDGSGEEASSPAAEAKPNVWANTNLTVLPARTSALPPHSKHHHQSRLQPPRDGFNLCLLVGKVDLVVDKYRVDGSRVLVAEVDVGDETGSISLRARDDQIDLLRKVSDDGGAIVLRNCTMELYQGKHLRLAVTKWGKMRPYPDGIESTPDPPSNVNYDLNFSLVDLNTVARTKMPDEQPFPMPAAAAHHKPPKQKQVAAARKQSDEPGSPKYRSRGHHSHQKKYQHRQQHPQNHPPSGQHNVNATGNQYLFQNQQQSGGGRGSANSPAFVPRPQVHFQKYSDAGSAYSYPSQQGGGQQQGGGSPHRQFLPSDHYSRQQQILYQQYELQQRHAHQMHILQQQQEDQRRMLEQQQQQQIATHTSLLPGLRRAESHESGGGDQFSMHMPVGGMGQHHSPPGLRSGPPPPPGSFPPAMAMPPSLSPPQPPMASPQSQLQHPVGMSSEYPYGSMGMSSPMGNVFQGEGPVGTLPAYATVISPPVSPANAPHPAPNKAPPQYRGGKVEGQYNPEKQE